MRSPFFVNLPLSYIADTPDYLAFFLDNRIPPELGLDAAALQTRDRAWHEATAAAIREAGLPCSAHLAFLDLHPGSLDDIVLAATRERLATCIAAARHYAPRLMIGHPDYHAAVHAGRAKEWLARCRDTWAGLLDQWPGHPPLYLENTFETDPEPLRDLLDALAEAGCERVHACFDVGHWHAFAHGHTRRDLARWLDVLGGRIHHLHLHDNDGSGDQHLGLGQGTIPWDELARELAARGLAPTATLEPHTEDALGASLAFLASRPELFAGIRSAHAA